MRAWLRANGGPPAVILIGVLLLVDGHSGGIWVIVGGALLWIGSTKVVLRRLPRLTFESGDGLALRVRPPELGLAQGWPRKQHLRDRAETLAAKLHALAAEGMAYEAPPWESSEWQQADEDGRQRLWHESTNRSMERSRNLMNRYDVEAGAEALALYHEFERRGVAKPGDQHWFEHPTNPLGIREVAKRLGLWAKQV